MLYTDVSMFSPPWCLPSHLLSVTLFLAVCCSVLFLSYSLWLIILWSLCAFLYLCMLMAPPDVLPSVLYPQVTKEGGIFWFVLGSRHMAEVDRYILSPLEINVSWQKSVLKINNAMHFLDKLCSLFFLFRSLGPENLLLKGATLKNTKKIYGKEFLRYKKCVF